MKFGRFDTVSKSKLCVICFLKHEDIRPAWRKKFITLGIFFFTYLKWNGTQEYNVLVYGWRFKLLKRG